MRVAVANQKGGVGKTTTAVNLVSGLAERGYRCLLVDLDPQANATTGLGIDHRKLRLSTYDVVIEGRSAGDAIIETDQERLHLLPSAIDLAGAELELVPAMARESKLRHGLQGVADRYDVVLIDCPPSLGLLTVNALTAADRLLIPIQCEYYALEGLTQLLRNIELVRSGLNARLEIGAIVLTMYDARTKLSEQVADEVRQHFPDRVFSTVIPRSVRLSEAPSYGQPAVTYDPSSRGAMAYSWLAEEFQARVLEPAGIRPASVPSPTREPVFEERVETASDPDAVVPPIEDPPSEDPVSTEPRVNEKPTVSADDARESHGPWFTPVSPSAQEEPRPSEPGGGVAGARESDGSTSRPVPPQEPDEGGQEPEAHRGASESEPPGPRGDPLSDAQESPESEARADDVDGSAEPAQEDEDTQSERDADEPWHRRGEGEGEGWR